jgi:alpha-soluble NSF attachment protein
MKINQKEAVRCLQQAVALYTEMGRLGMAARQLREIAEVMEREGDDSRQDAVIFYEQAADLYQTENQTAEANKCLLKIAQYSAELEAYPRAIQIYEAVAKAAVDNNLLKYSAKNHLMCAGMCVMASSDISTTRETMEKYEDIDLAFQDSREAKLLGALTDAWEAGDVDEYTMAIAEYDSLTRLDGWKTTMLVSYCLYIEGGGEYCLDEI